MSGRTFAVNETQVYDNARNRMVGCPALEAGVIDSGTVLQFEPLFDPPIARIIYEYDMIAENIQLSTLPENLDAQPASIVSEEVAKEAWLKAIELMARTGHGVAQEEGVRVAENLGWLIRDEERKDLQSLLEEIHA